MVIWTHIIILNINIGAISKMKNQLLHKMAEDSMDICKIIVNQTRMANTKFETYFKTLTLKGDKPIQHKKLVWTKK